MHRNRADGLIREAFYSEIRILLGRSKQGERDVWDM